MFITAYHSTADMRGKLVWGPYVTGIGFLWAWTRGSSTSSRPLSRIPETTDSYLRRGEGRICPQSLFHAVRKLILGTPLPMEGGGEERSTDREAASYSTRV